VITATKH